MPDRPHRPPFDRQAAFARWPELETGRLLLRPITPADARDLLDIYGDPEVGRYNSWTPLNSPEDAEKKIALFREQFEKGQRIRWGIVWKETGKLVGDCALVRLEDRGHRAEIGFNLARACWGRGIMREALEAMLAYAFEELGLNRMEAMVMPGNAGSEGLLSRLGFQKEGRLRQSGFVNGAYCDSDLYALLYQEFAAGKVAGRAVND